MSTLLNDSSSLAPTINSASTAKNLENIKSSVSLAYEKGMMKEKCGLCKMYFHRNSVNYKVPCHRILEMERKWNIVKEGRRYGNAAFLYRTVNVCCFCSQFFRLLAEDLPEEPIKAVSTKVDVALDKMKLEITTKLERSNIATGQRAYQSSVVDNCIADNALQGPLFARTLREVDPWWEVDFSRKFHLHSLSFVLSTYRRQKLTVFICLLDRPYGYEDPFLDSIKGRASLTKTINIKEKDESGVQSVEWEFPAHTFCSAIRVQLLGIHPLGITGFQAFVGDILVPASETDLQNTFSSFATLSPAAVKTGFKEMMSPEMKKELVWKAEAMKARNEHARDGRMKPVDQLLSIVEDRNNAQAQWKEKVLLMASVFTEEEVEALYRIIFKYACDLNQRNINVPNLKESELRSAAILQYHPRCELDELHQRVRSVVRWIQSGSHSKSLGCLAKARCFEVAASDPGKHLYLLMSAFKRVERYREKMDWKAKSFKLHDEMCISASWDSEGCSWSQFLSIMSLFCQSQTKNIPEVVFLIKDKRAAYGQKIMNNYSEDDYDLKSYASGDGRSVSTYSIMTELDAEEDDDPSMIDPNWLRGLAAPKKLDVNQMKKELESKRTFLQKAREQELFPYFNSTYSEYKFAKFKRRMTFRELSFPRRLDLKFAKSLQPKKGAPLNSVLQSREAPQQEPEKMADLRKSMSTTHALATSRSTASVGTPLGGMTSPNPKIQLSPIGRPRTTAVDLVNRGMLIPSPQRPYTSQSAPVLPSTSALTSRTTSKNAISFMDKELSNTASGNIGTFSRQASRKMSSFITAADSDSESANDLDFLDDDFNGAYGNRTRPPKMLEFFRICSLCEVKFPRHAIERKVLRKHIIELRTSWDPKLIPKEKKLLENSISMYNLVYVCLFCYQFFDPDFPGGIAYPVRVDSPSASKRPGVLGVIDSQQSPSKMAPFYDLRFESDAKNIGEVLCRPATMESRSRALRAIEISKSLDSKI